MALKDDLIAVWCESANPITDQHQNGLTLTNNNSVTTTVGKVGTAGVFVRASSQSLSRASEVLLQTGDIAFTEAAWVQIASKPVGGNLYVSGKGDGGAADERFMFYRNVAAEDRFRFFIAAFAVGASANTFGSPSINTWYYLQVQHDPIGDKIRIRVNNGTWDEVATLNVGPTAGTGPFYLGAYANGGFPSNFHDGLINQFAFWKALKSDADLDTIYNLGNGLAFSSWDAVVKKPSVVSQDANIPNCILTQLARPAVIVFANSFNQLYKNSTLSGFGRIGFWELEEHPSWLSIQPGITSVNSIANDVSIGVSQTDKWVLATTKPISNSYVLSTDGANTWAEITSPSTPALWKFVGFGNGVWVLCEDTGTFWTSTTALVASWTVNAYTFPDVGFIRAGRFRDGNWVIVSSNGDIAHSTNGTTWTNADTTIFTECRDTEFSFVTSNWMVVGVAGGVGRTALSADGGVTWVLTTGLLANCTVAKTVEYHNNAWFVGGNAGSGLGLWRSTDNGVNWTQMTAASTGFPTNGQIANLDIVGEFRNTIIAMSSTDGQIYFSLYGLSWLQFQLGPFEFN